MGDTLLLQYSPTEAPSPSILPGLGVLALALKLARGNVTAQPSVGALQVKAATELYLKICEFYLKTADRNR